MKSKLKKMVSLYLSSLRMNCSRSKMTNVIPKLVANYEATVSTGLEAIARDEIKQKFYTEARTQQGRIWFSTDEPVENLIKLKTISNLFVIIYETNLEKDQLPADGNSLEPLLTDIGEKCDWTTGLEVWQRRNNFKCPMSKILTKNVDLREEQPKFRVSSNRYGPEHKFTSPEICSVFGHVLDTKFGWPIKMKGYDLEIMVNINVNHLYVGITLTPISLDRRNIVAPGFTTLRAATCYALLRMAEIQCGDILIDPMAGSGAIPVECCSAWKDEWLAFTIAGELKAVPLGRCKLNMDGMENGSPNDILKLDVTTLPFRDDSLDVFVSDLPFGRRHGTKKQNRTLYPALLRDMARTARVGSARAILLTQDSKSMIFAYHQNRAFWDQKLCSFVKIGNLSCWIYSFLRNDTKFDINKLTSNFEE